MKFLVKAHRIETLSQTVESNTPEEAIEKAKAQPNWWYPGPFERSDPGWAFGADPVYDANTFHEREAMSHDNYQPQPATD